MTTQLTAAALALVLGTGAVSTSHNSKSRQEVGFNTQVAFPVLQKVQSSNLNATAELIAEPTTVEQKLSVKLTDAKVSDLIEVLAKSNISVVIDQDDIKSKVLNINLAEVSVEAAMEALGEVLDGKFVNRNNIWVFRKGNGFAWATIPGQATTEAKTLFKPDLAPMPSRPIDPKAMKKLEAEAERMAKDMMRLQKELQFDEKTMRTLVPPMPLGAIGTDLDAVRKEIAEARKALKSELTENVKLREIEKILERVDKELGAARAQNKRAAVMAPRVSADIEKTMTVRLAKMDEFLKSVTPKQRELLKKQGHLKLSDLSPKQRELLGITGTGELNIEIVRDGEKIVIKN